MTNPEKVKYDDFSVTIVSSGETLEDYCDYETLSFFESSLM
jgi:hypothetical protein